MDGVVPTASADDGGARQLVLVEATTASGVDCGIGSNL